MSSLLDPPPPEPSAAKLVLAVAGIAFTFVALLIGYHVEDGLDESMIGKCEDAYHPGYGMRRQYFIDTCLEEQDPDFLFNKP